VLKLYCFYETNISQINKNTEYKEMFSSMYKVKKFNCNKKWHWCGKAITPILFLFKSVYSSNTFERPHKRINSFLKKKREKKDKCSEGVVAASQEASPLLLHWLLSNDKNVNRNEWLPFID